MQVYYDRDADAWLIKSNTGTVIGFRLGHAHMLNPRDSGFANVVVIPRAGSLPLQEGRSRSEGYQTAWTGNNR